MQRTLQDRPGLELAGFDPAAVDAVVKAAESDPEKAADLLHASWKETTTEKRREKSARKLAVMKGQLQEEQEQQQQPDQDHLGIKGFG